VLRLPVPLSPHSLLLLSLQRELSLSFPVAEVVENELLLLLLLELACHLVGLDAPLDLVQSLAEEDRLGVFLSSPASLLRGRELETLVVQMLRGLVHVEATRFRLRTSFAHDLESGSSACETMSGVEILGYHISCSTRGDLEQGL